jgi:hypothetical protein
MKVQCYLVLGKVRSSTSVRRVTHKRPALANNEAMVRLDLDLPDDIFDAPLVTVPIERGKIAVAVEAKEVE